MVEALSPRAELIAAIRRYVASTSAGHLATDWVLFAAHVGNGPGTGYTVALPDDISYHAATGLAMHLPDALEERFNAR